MKKILFLLSLCVGFSAHANVIPFWPVDVFSGRTFKIPFKVVEEAPPHRFESEGSKVIQITFDPYLPYPHLQCEYSECLSRHDESTKNPVHLLPLGDSVDLKALVSAAADQKPIPSDFKSSELCKVISQETREELAIRTSTMLIPPDEVVADIREHLVDLHRKTKSRLQKKNPWLVGWISTFLQGKTPGNVNVSTYKNAIRLLFFGENYEIHHNPEPGVSFRATFPTGTNLEVLTRHKNFNGCPQYKRYLIKSIRSFLEKPGI